MNKEATQELMMGAVLVLLAYAAYRHFTANNAPPTAGEPAAPRQGIASSLLPSTTKRPTTQARMPSPYTSLTDLLSGTTHDIGAYEGRNYLDEISYVRGAETGMQTSDVIRMPRVGELSIL